MSRIPGLTSAIPVHSPSWQVWRWRGIRGWVPVIGAAKDVLDRIICRIGVGKLFGPRRALGRIRTGTGAAVLGVARRLLVRGIAPVIPPLRLDVIAHLTVDVSDARV